ncbi:MAG TPA: PQQ-binding-like beta-propeller repeat protein [Chthonomonadaceae bacterium]|nr:PQQ-binding-like beta-propeller repeat protein [Chthonomonadaceae bacterium]
MTGLMHLLLSLCVLGWLALSAAQGAEGDWPMWRHDTSLTAYQPLPGAMRQPPRVLARYFVGSGQGAHRFADLRGSGRDTEILVTARARLMAYSEQGKLLWQSAPPGYVISDVAWVEDLDGDGRKEVVALAGHLGGTRQAYLILDGQTGRLRAAIDINTGDFGWRGCCGAYLPDARGKQIFVVTSMRQAQGGPPASNGEFALWSFDGHRAIRRWAWTPKEYAVEYPAVMLGDLNGEGHTHAVVDSWCHVWNLDLATGALASHTTWDPQGANKRHYGWNELVDVDGDGKLDFVNISLTKHVDVLRNVGGKLELAWTRGWPDPVTTEARSIRMPSDPVSDLDGDGKKELVAALFDGTTDKRWHLFIWDGVTGAQKAEAPDLVPIASVPIRGEHGGRALLCVRSAGLQFDPPASYEVWRLQGGQLTRLWASSTAAFLLESLPADARRDFAFNAVGVRRAVMAGPDGGRAAFFTTEKGGQAAQGWAIQADGAVVTSTETPPAPPVPRALPDLPPLQGVMAPYLLAADIDGDGRNEVLLYDNATVTVLRLEGDALRLVETFPSSEIPIVCDLLGDGKPYVLTAGRGADGNLWVQARGPDRKTLWQYVFPQSAACGQYSERPHYFTVGHFTGGKHLDVFTYSTKPAARAYVLDGRTGKPVWEREEVPGIERHFQAFGGRAVAWDFNGDGTDDIVFCNPDFYCIADGKTGNLLVGPVNIAQVLKWWAAYASPTVLQRAGEAPFVYLGGAYSCRAGLSLDGTRGLWLEYLPTERWPLRGGNAGFSEGLLPPSRVISHGSKEERGWRGAQVEADGTLVCFDAATGRHLWQMGLSTAPSGIVSGDVDGEGAPELLFGGQDGNLLAVRDAGDRGKVVWRKTFAAPVGTPILADVNGDGKSEVVVSVGDGYVYVLGR